MRTHTLSYQFSSSRLRKSVFRKNTFHCNTLLVSKPLGYYCHGKFFFRRSEVAPLRVFGSLRGRRTEDGGRSSCWSLEPFLVLVVLARSLTRPKLGSSFNVCVAGSFEVRL